MKIVLAAHGGLAQEFKNTARMFFGSEVDDIVCVSLLPSETISDFKEALLSAVALGGDEETLILCDMLGGSPCNQAALLVGEHVRVVTGLNLGMLLEAISSKGDAKPDGNALEQAGISGIKDLNSLMD